MLRKLVLLLSFLLSASVFSQIGGKAVYQFLNLAQSPRQAALGGKTVTVVDYDVIKHFIIQLQLMPKCTKDYR